MKSPAVFIALILGAASALVLAQPASRHFRYERTVVTSGPGHFRLAVDVTLLANAAPFDVRPRPASAPGDALFVAVGGLADLRLFNAAGQEVPYLLLWPPASQPSWARSTLQPIAGTKKTSGFEADLGDVVTVDRIQFNGLPRPFLKRVQIEGSGDRQRWTLLSAEGTVFDLPDEGLRHLDVPFAAGAYRYLRVTWDDTHSGKVPAPAAVLARRVPANAPARGNSVPLTIERRSSEPGISRYVVHLPGARLPIAALVLDVAATHVLRDATVTESRLVNGQAAPVPLGRATLRRVTVGSLSATDLRIPILAPTEAQLDLTIGDADNPPLVISGVSAEMAELPWIYFESDGSSIVARYGADRREAPRYDLEAARESIRVESASFAAWGAARPLDTAAEATASPLPTEGAAIDVSLFRHVRDVPAGDAGLVALALDAAVLAESAGPAGGFADVRVVTNDAHQVPYLIERRDEPLGLDISLTRRAPPTALKRPDRQSVYALHLPFASLPAARLVVSTDARVFDRSVTVGVERSPDRTSREPWIEDLIGTRWIHTDRDRPTPPLLLSLRPTAATDLVVIVDEGDNQPLPLGQARLLLPSYRLRFYRNAGSALRIAYGRNDLSAPRYDLALLGPHVLGVAATEVAMGPESAPPAPRTVAIASPVVFWVVLTSAVAVLVGFIVRLLRKPTQ